jgi:hypothetical protein
MTIIEDVSKWYQGKMTQEEKLVQIKKLIREEWRESHILCFDLASEIISTIEAIIEEEN